MQAALLLLLDDDDDGPGTALYAYDANGRLTTVATQGGTAQSYAYDPLGNILGITSVTNNLSVPATGSTGQAPTIFGFTPSGGNAPTSVIVSGANFQPVVGQTVVLLGSTTTSPTSISDGQIIFPVPPNQGTAPIQVITPYGSATSSLPFNVPPGGVTLTSTVPLTVGGSAQTLTISSASAAAAYLFNAQVGSWISLQLSSLSTTPSSASVSYTIYGPNNQSITTGTVSANSLSIHLPPIPTTGNYLAVFNSGSSTSVSMTGAVSVNPTIAVGSSTATSIGVAGQSQRVRFASSQTASLVVLDMTTQATTPSGQSLTPTYLSSNASTISTGLGIAPGSGLHYGPFAAGTVGGLLISAPPGATGTAQLLLDTSSTAVVIDGAATTVQSTIPGQAVQFNFAGTAGQNLVMALTGATTAPTAGSSLTAYLYDPSGQLVFQSTSCTSGCSWAFPALGSTGQYIFVLAPDPGPVTFSGSLTLSSAVSGTLTTTSSTNVNLSSPGQTAALSFSGTSGQPMLITINQVTIPAGNSLYAIVNDHVRGDFETNNSTANPMIFFISSAYVSEGPFVLKLVVAATGTPVSRLQQGSGTAGTGSAKVYLDTTPVILTVNRSGTTNPVSTPIATTVYGSGRMASVQLPINPSQNYDSANLSFSNTNVPNGQLAVTMYAPGGNYFNPIGNQPGNLYNAICPSSSGTCGPITYNTGSSGSSGRGGVYYLVFTPCGNTASCGLTTPSGWFTNLPQDVNTNFSTNVTVITNY